MAYEVTARSTQHGSNTPHGYNTPHKYPESEPTQEDILINLVKSLYPTGRVWNMPERDNFENLHRALNKSFIRVIEYARGIFDSVVPDNENFDEEDAALWEYRLGLISNSSVDLENRRAAILRKLAFPSNIKARQSPLYIEHQLRLAGFDVYIHENTKPYKTPDEVAALSVVNIQHGPPTQHGNSTQHGNANYKVVANSLDENEVYSIGGDENLYATFFIAGPNIEDIATVPKERVREFRELVLKLKPAHTVAFLLINFV